jgi:DnaJ-class molecular chaperone
MLKKNYYKILKISKNSTSDEIKKAFKSLALTQHPDKGGTTESFSLIQEAYSVLYDQEKRKEYDLLNEEVVNEDMYDDDSPVKQQFDEVCIWKQSYDKGTPTPNIHITVDVTLEDIMNHRIFKIHPICITPCSLCGGCGYISRSIVDCVLCEGNGLYSTILGDILYCGHCHGRGKLSIEAPQTKCPKCKGVQYFKRIFTFHVSSYHVVVHSIKHPDKNPIIIFYGKGNNLYDNPPGDLIIHFNEIPHSDYTRDQMDICYTKYLTLYDTLYGLTFDIVTLTHKTLRIILPSISNLEGSIDKDWFEKIIAGEGLETPDGIVRGNLKVLFKIIIPNLIENNQEILKKIFLESQTKLKTLPKSSSIVTLKSEKHT